MTTATPKTIIVRAKAFASESTRQYRCCVEPDGSVLVYDTVAGHYTRCHSLSPAAQRRIRRLAK